MGAYDLLGTAEAVERRPPESCRLLPCAGDVLLPQPTHDQLQVGRLDALDRGAISIGVVVDGAAASFADQHPTHSNLVQHRVDETRLDSDLPVDEVVVALDRSLDGRARRRPIQVLDTQIVRKQIGDAAFEAVQLGERVLTDGYEEARTQPN